MKELAALQNLARLELDLHESNRCRSEGTGRAQKPHRLDLCLTKVTDAGLKELAALKRLTKLGLTDTKVTDAGMKELAALKNLTSLILVNTKVTDAGLKELAALKNLTSL